MKNADGELKSAEEAKLAAEKALANIDAGDIANAAQKARHLKKLKDAADKATANFNEKKGKHADAKKRYEETHGVDTKPASDAAVDDPEAAAAAPSSVDAADVDVQVSK